jgi:hypothetical protein
MTVNAGISLESGHALAFFLVMVGAGRPIYRHMGRQTGSKARLFFSEEKNQKTFVWSPLQSHQDMAGRYPLVDRRV